MPSSMHNVIVLAHVIILSFMCACCKANLIIIIKKCILVGQDCHNTYLKLKVLSIFALQGGAHAT